MKSDLEMDSGFINKEQAMSSNKADLVEGDIENIKDQVGKLKRTIRNIKTELFDEKTKDSELKSDLTSMEEELKNILLSQKNKENTLHSLTEKANMLENEINMIDNEKEDLKEAYSNREEILKNLTEHKGEIARKQTSLIKEKMTLESMVEEVDRNVGKRKADLSRLENDKLTYQHELKNLEQFYNRLANENRKLIENLNQMIDSDESASRVLERTDKIDHIIHEANKELSNAIKVIREA